MESVYLLLSEVQRQSSPISNKYVRQLMSSILRADQMKIDAWGELHAQLCNVKGFEDGGALRVLLFAMIQSSCRRGKELTLLKKHAGMEDEPQLVDFSHMKCYNDLALAKVFADLHIATDGFSRVFVAFFVRTHLSSDNPSTYLDDRATKTTFEQSVRLLNDAKHCGVFDLEDFSKLRSSFKLNREYKADKELTNFERELQQTPVGHDQVFPSPPPKYDDPMSTNPFFTPPLHSKAAIADSGRSPRYEQQRAQHSLQEQPSLPMEQQQQQHPPNQSSMKQSSTQEPQMTQHYEMQQQRYYHQQQQQQHQSNTQQPLYAHQLQQQERPHSIQQHPQQPQLLNQPLKNTHQSLATQLQHQQQPQYQSSSQLSSTQQPQVPEYHEQQRWQSQHLNPQPITQPPIADMEKLTVQQSSSTQVPSSRSSRQLSNTQQLVSTREHQQQPQLPNRPMQNTRQTVATQSQQLPQYQSSNQPYYTEQPHTIHQRQQQPQVLNLPMKNAPQSLGTRSQHQQQSEYQSSSLLSSTQQSQITQHHEQQQQYDQQYQSSTQQAISTGEHHLQPQVPNRPMHQRTIATQQQPQYQSSSQLSYPEQPQVTQQQQQQYYQQQQHQLNTQQPLSTCEHQQQPQLPNPPMQNTRQTVATQSQQLPQYQSSSQLSHTEQPHTIHQRQQQSQVLNRPMQNTQQSLATQSQYEQQPQYQPSNQMISTQEPQVPEYLEQQRWQSQRLNPQPNTQPPIADMEQLTVQQSPSSQVPSSQYPQQSPGTHQSATIQSRSTYPYQGQFQQGNVHGSTQHQQQHQQQQHQSLSFQSLSPKLLRSSNSQQFPNEQPQPGHSQYQYLPKQQHSQWEKENSQPMGTIPSQPNVPPQQQPPLGAAAMDVNPPPPRPNNQQQQRQIHPSTLTTTEHSLHSNPSSTHNMASWTDVHVPAPVTSIPEGVHTQRRDTGLSTSSSFAAVSESDLVSSYGSDSTPSMSFSESSFGQTAQTNQSAPNDAYYMYQPNADQRDRACSDSVVRKFPDPKWNDLKSRSLPSNTAPPGLSQANQMSLEASRTSENPSSLLNRRIHSQDSEERSVTSEHSSLLRSRGTYSQGSGDRSMTSENPSSLKNRRAHSQDSEERSVTSEHPSSHMSRRIYSQESGEGNDGAHAMVSAAPRFSGSDHGDCSDRRANFQRQGGVDSLHQVQYPGSIIDHIAMLTRQSYAALPYNHAANLPDHLNHGSILIEVPLQEVNEHFEVMGNVRFDQLFPARSEGETHRVVVAPPGHGKSILLIRAAKEWEKGSILTNMSVVLLVPMCKLPETTNVDLECLLGIYLDNPEMCKNAATALSQEAGKELCILFDGVEEDSLRRVLDFILGERLQNATVYATCRPGLATQMKDPKVKFYTIGSLKSSHIEDYASRAFTKPEMFLEILNKNPNVEMMCSVPVCLSIIACLFHALGNEALKSPSVSETEIIEAFAFHVIKTNKRGSLQFRHLSDVELHYADEFKLLCNLAIHLAEENTVVVPPGYFGEAEKQVQELFKNLLVMEEKISAHSTQYVHQFSHSTIRDFFAAYGLKSIENVQMDMQKLPSGVLKVLCGLLSEQLQENTLSRIIISNTDKDGQVTMLPFHCVYQTKNKSLYTHLVRKLKDCVKFCTSDTSLTVSGGYVLARVIQNCPVYELEFGPRFLNADCLKVFSDTLLNNGGCLPQLRKLSIYGHLGSDAAEYVENILLVHTNVESLSLSGIEVTPQILLSIGNLKNLTSLTLSQCAIDYELAKDLSQALEHLPRLKEFDVGYNSFGDDGLHNVQPGLSCCHSVSMLRLCGCMLHSGAILLTIAKTLTLLESLDLSDNSFGNQGIHSMMAVANDLSQLKVLSFANNQLDNDVLPALCGFAFCCKSLTELRLSGNDIKQDSDNLQRLRTCKPSFTVIL